MRDEVSAMPPDGAPPKRVHVLHEMRCPVLRERDVGEAGAFQQAAELVSVREAQARMARRQHVWRPGANLRHGVTDQALDALLVGGVPPGESDATAQLERAQALCEGSFGIGKVPEPKGAHHRVEHAIWHGKMLHICHLKVDAGMAL